MMPSQFSFNAKARYRPHRPAVVSSGCIRYAHAEGCPVAPGEILSLFIIGTIEDSLKIFSFAFFSRGQIHSP